MGMVWRAWILAWRNLWRVPRRTWLTAGALALGVALMVLSQSFADAMMQRMVQEYTGAFSGHAQLHRQGYRREREQSLVLPQGQSLLKKARALPGVAWAFPRVYVEGLAAMGDRSQGVALLGVDMALEAHAQGWGKRLVAGRLPRAANEVLIGFRMAKTLELEPGSPLVLTVSQTGTGDLGYQQVRVAGLLYTGQEELDQNTVLAPLEKVQEWTHLPGQLHEIALMLREKDLDEPAIQALLKPLAAKNLEILSWRQLFPALAQMQALMGVWMLIALVIVYLLIGLGVVNTLAMSLLERMREFGVLKAIGTSGFQLSLMVGFEALCLGLLGSLLGAVLGLSVVGWLCQVGVSLSEVEMMGMRFESTLYPILNPLALIQICVAFVLLTPAVALGIVNKAARVDPVTVLRMEGR